ncbi:MAG TPA: hypothetical protein VF627_08045, partial [Abditibacterium sp.]
MNPEYDTSVNIDLLFQHERPAAEDLHMIRGWPVPGRPPSGRFNFDKLSHFGFDQVDDYYGIKSFEDEGTDVVVWLYPLVDGDSVYHHP